MVSKQSVIVFLRSTSVRCEPVVLKRAKVAAKAGLTPVLIYWAREGSDHQTNEDGVEFSPVVINGHYGKGILSLHQRIRFMAAAFRRIAELQPRMIHACDFDMMLLACMVRPFCAGKPKIVYDILDFIYEFTSPLPKFLRRAFSTLDHWFFRAADAILLPDENRRARLATVSEAKVDFVYNAPDWEVDAEDQRRCSAGATLPRRLRLLYAGGFSRDRGLPMLMDAVAERPDRYELILAGQGVDAHVAQRMADTHENIKFLGQINFSEVKLLTASADLLYAAYDPSVSVNRAASPNKFFEAVTLGKPILVARGTSIDERVEALDCGWAIDFSPSALRAALDSISDRDVVAKGDSAALAREQYGWAASARTLTKVYERFA